MRRRPFLHLAVAAVATGGCLDRPESAGESPAEGSSAAATTTATARSETTESGTDSVTESESDLGKVERIESFDYVVRMNDLGHDPGGGITRFSALDDRERAVVEGALGEGYETDDPPAWLAQFASATPFVERSGNYYRIDHDLPTTTVTAEAVDESAVDGEIADSEAYREAVTHDGRVMSGLLRIAREEGVEFTYVWPSLRAFFEEYAAVDYHGDVVSFSVTVEDSGPPYEITASEVSVSEAVRADVWNASAADAEARELVRAAGDESGTYGFDDPPKGLLDALDSHRYALLDGTFYTTYVESREPAPVSLSAEFADGELTLSLRNDADREIEVSTGAPPPFGVVHAESVGESDDTHLLWTDAYEDNDHVHTEGREVKAVNAIGLVVTLAPDETASETYEVPTAEMPPGEYVLNLSVGVDNGENGGEGSTARYRVVFSVE